MKCRFCGAEMIEEEDCFYCPVCDHVVEKEGPEV